MILYLKGQVDERTLEKYQKEAKEKNRESWVFAYVLDLGEENKEKLQMYQGLGLKQKGKDTPF